MLCPWSASSSSTPSPGHTCRECDGGGVCKHGRMRSACNECGGASFCEHRRRRSQCKECSGSSICEHGHRRSKCKYGCGDGHVIILDATAVEEFDGYERGEPKSPQPESYRPSRSLDVEGELTSQLYAPDNMLMSQGSPNNIPHECSLVQARTVMAVGPRAGKRERDSNIKEAVELEFDGYEPP